MKYYAVKDLPFEIFSGCTYAVQEKWSFNSLLLICVFYYKDHIIFPPLPTSDELDNNI